MSPSLFLYDVTQRRQVQLPMHVFANDRNIKATRHALFISIESFANCLLGSNITQELASFQLILVYPFIRDGMVYTRQDVDGSGLELPYTID